MENWIWVLGGVVLGGAVGLAAYVWDAMDGQVDMIGGVIHRPVLTVGLAVLSLETLAWAFELVSGYFVLGGLLGLVAQGVIAFMAHLAAPIIKAFLPKPAIP